MEILLHYFYIFAMNRSQYSSLSFNSAELAINVMLTLTLIWLKFLIIWRFFRLWALYDQIYVIENMNRCVYNNYTAKGFWRSWHRSFNRWLIRYIYIPCIRVINSKLISTFIVFTFVAFWHDRSLQLLTWGWFTVLTFIPELFIFKYLNLNNKYLKGFIAVFNIIGLMIANMIGYSIGINDTKRYF